MYPLLFPKKTVIIVWLLSENWCYFVTYVYNKKLSKMYTMSTWHKLYMEDSDN